MKRTFTMVAIGVLALTAIGVFLVEYSRLEGECDIDLTPRQIKVLSVHTLRDRGFKVDLAEDEMTDMVEHGKWTIRTPEYALRKTATSEYEMTKYDVELAFKGERFWFLVSPCATVNMLGHGRFHK